jgi:tryptophan 2,3-dioxygenase
VFCKYPFSSFFSFLFFKSNNMSSEDSNNNNNNTSSHLGSYATGGVDREVHPRGCPFMMPDSPGAVPSIMGFSTPAQGFVPPTSAQVVTESEKRARESITGACHYSEYLALTELLNAQSGPSLTKPGGKGMMHHEENLFVIVHQTFELWFKMVLVDTERCREMLYGILDTVAKKKAGTEKISSEAMLTQMNGNLSLCLNYLRRIESIILHSSGAFSILETMHCGDFLEFRDYLLPASGFQSVQFRKLEKELGVQDEPRALVNGVEVFKYLRPEEQDALAELGRENINNVVNKILATLAVPSDFLDTYQECARRVMVDQQTIIAKGDTNDPKIAKLIEGYCSNLKNILDDPVGWCEGLTLHTEEEKAEFKKAAIACLFVYQYRQDPEYAVLASVLEQLVAVEESLLVWRSRHLHMAERMIGRRTGTGGSSGVGYLDVTRRYRIFHALWLVRKLTIRSSVLPPLKTMRSNATELFA